MRRERFELALDQVGPEDGVLFETLASAFAATEYPNLRTVASVSGDGGRDAFLYTTDDSLTVLQYSVTAKWDQKIVGTANRLKETFPTTRELIYVTNQRVGARGDDLRRRLRSDFSMFLDIWDREWFLDRLNTNIQREAAAEALAVIKVDPLVAAPSLVTAAAPALSTEEQRTAAVYLTMQLEDEGLEKGLTRLCYESLVRAALRGTSSTNRLTRDQVHEKVKEMTPSTQDAGRFIDSALNKLSKKLISHWEKTDEFHLRHDESQRAQRRLNDFKLHEARLLDELGERLSDALAVDKTSLSDEDFTRATGHLRSLLDTVLSKRGESFASALTVGEVARHEADRLAKRVQSEAQRVDSTLSFKVRDALASAALSILTTPDSASRTYLQYWSQSYTLFSLLRETPDVQATMVKLFSSGRLWLDANVILPVLAEELADDDRQQSTALLRAARECGLELFATPGVIEELIFHMRKSLTYLRTSQQKRTWNSQVPFLYTAHAFSGRPRDEFPSWLENFRGEVQPEEDLAEYLEERLGLKVRSLEKEAEEASVDLRGAIQEAFYETKEKRISRRDQNPTNLAKLVAHDVECYLGILQLRRKERQSTLGFNSWWVTLDSTAYRASSRLRESLGAGAPSVSPVMNPDFLLNYLEIGPARARVSSGSTLPLIIDIGAIEGVSPEIMDRMEKVRQDNVGKPERLVRRLIRDNLNSMRLSAAVADEAGSGGAFVEAEILEAIEESSH